MQNIDTFVNSPCEQCVRRGGEGVRVVDETADMANINCNPSWPLHSCGGICRGVLLKREGSKGLGG